MTGVLNPSNNNGKYRFMFLAPILTKLRFTQTGYLYLSSNSENKQVLFSLAELTYVYFYWRISVSLCDTKYNIKCYFGDHFY